MRSYFYACAICLSLHVLSAGIILADEPEELEIERIVVTASRTPEEIKNATKHTTIIDQEDIKNSNAQTITDVLRSVPGVTVRDYSGNGKQVNVDMRGFGETGPSNILVLIDGRRINAIDLSNTDWSQISLSQVERIEIVRGASSVLYGDNADGGVVNIITKIGSGTPVSTIEQKGGSYDAWGTTFTSGGSSEKSSYRISGEVFSTEGYRQNNDFDRLDLGLQLKHEFHPLLQTNLTVGFHEDAYGLPGALKENELNLLGRRATTKPDDNAKSNDQFVNLQVGHDFNQEGKLTTDFSVRTRSVDSQYTAMSWRNENYILTLGCTPKYTLKNSIGDKDNTFIAGADFYFAQDNILDGALTGPNDTIHIKKNSQGLYAQDEFKLTDHILFKGGIRGDMAQFNFRQITQVALKEKSRLNENAFNAGISYLTGETGSIYLDYSTSFRYPLVDEFFTSNTYGFGGLNASLNPQTGKNWEFGLRHQFSDNILTNINYFLQNIKNEIYFNPVTFVNANYDKTTHQGITCDANIKLSDAWTLFANYAYTSATFGSGSFKGNTVPAVPNHKTSVGMGWTPAKNWRLNMLLNYVGSMFLISDPANVYPKLNDYVTLNTNASYTFNNLEIFLGLNNIFDAEYSEYAVVSTFSGVRNFYPAPDRNVMAGIRCKF